MPTGTNIQTSLVRGGSETSVKKKGFQKWWHMQQQAQVGSSGCSRNRLRRWNAKKLINKCRIITLFFMVILNPRLKTESGVSVSLLAVFRDSERAHKSISAKTDWANKTVVKGPLCPYHDINNQFVRFKLFKAIHRPSSQMPVFSTHHCCWIMAWFLWPFSQTARSPLLQSWTCHRWGCLLYTSPSPRD